MNSKCLSNNALFVAHCVTDIVLDIVIMGLPIPLVSDILLRYLSVGIER